MMEDSRNLTMEVLLLWLGGQLVAAMPEWYQSSMVIDSKLCDFCIHHFLTV
jgi:hypothetical protein